MKRFVLDPDHTAAEFTIRHMMVTWVRGQFPGVKGSLLFDPKELAHSSVEAEIDAAGIMTGVQRRDDDLRSPNYLDVERYPKILFKSTMVELAGLDHLFVHGDLTIKDVTRQVLLDVVFAGPSHFQDDDGFYTTYGFRAETLINREDFGLKRNLELENGGFMVGKHAYLTINAEADLVEG